MPPHILKHARVHVGSPASPSKSSPRIPQDAKGNALSSGDAAAHAATGSLDDLLESQIGQFGKGQLLIMTAASLVFVPMALVLMLMVFITKDPVEARLWSCTNDTSSTGSPLIAAVALAACTALLEAPEGVITQDFCADVYPVRSSFKWMQQGQSIASEWDLVCSDAWKLPFVNSFCECTHTSVSVHMCTQVATGSSG